MPLYDRLETAIQRGLDEKAPAKHILQMCIDQLLQPSPEIIDQGCVALMNRQRELQDAKWSVDRHELAKIKMQFRWKAMIRALKRGM